MPEETLVEIVNRCAFAEHQNLAAEGVRYHASENRLVWLDADAPKGWSDLTKQSLINDMLVGFSSELLPSVIEAEVFPLVVAWFYNSEYRLETSPS